MGESEKILLTTSRGKLIAIVVTILVIGIVSPMFFRATEQTSLPLPSSTMTTGSTLMPSSSVAASPLSTSTYSPTSTPIIEPTPPAEPTSPLTQTYPAIPPSTSQTTTPSPTTALPTSPPPIPTSSLTTPTQTSPPPTTQPPTVPPPTTPPPTNYPVDKSLMENGLCYGPFRDGQSPNVAIFPTSEQIKEDLDSVKTITSNIRTYSATDILASIPSMAKQNGLTVYLGAYLSSNLTKNDAEVTSAINLAKQKLADSVVVGNEVILANLLSENNLIYYIRHVKQNIPVGIPVTTAEPWSVWLSHPDLVKEVDYLLVHVHPFWENQTIDRAAAYVIEKFNQVKAKFPDKQIMIGETAWPSAGDPVWAGVSPGTLPSEANQKRFLQEFVQLAAKNSVKYFYFDAFDEEWKWTERLASGNSTVPTEPLDRTFSGHMVGSSWGIFQSNGKLKPQLSNFFAKAQPVLSRTTRDIYVNGRLSAEYDTGVNTSGNLTGWLTATGDSMRLSYPSRQSWGVAFVTVGKPVNPPRPWKAFSEFRTISFTIRGTVGHESVQVGLKDANDRDDGNETKITISNLSTSWTTYTYPLSLFNSADLTKLYVVLEFVFSGPSAQTVYFNKVGYSP